jgi:hypothetical protein
MSGKDFLENAENQIEERRKEKKKLKTFAVKFLP